MKENQGEMYLYKRREANPSKGENPEDKSWLSRLDVKHGASNPIPKKKKKKKLKLKKKKYKIK